MQTADEYISHQVAPCLQRQMVRPISLQEPKSGSQRAAPHSALRNGMGKAVTQTEVRLKANHVEDERFWRADNKNAYITWGHARCRSLTIIRAEAMQPRTKPKQGPRSRVAACPVM